MDVEDYIDVVRRHKGWIVGPAFAALVLSVVLAFFWPDTYISTATIQVVLPQVPERYIPSNVNSEMTQRINAMLNSIESRANLTNLINTHSLYRSQVARKPLEDVIEDMRKDIHITQAGSLQTQNKGPISAFQVSFEYSNRYIAQKITAELARNFIDANIRTLASQSAATTDFLKDQWEAAKKQLDELENRMTEFRVKNAGRLPEELAPNLQTLRSLETQLAGVNDAMNRIGQSKLMLEGQIRIYREQLTALAQGAEAVSSRVKDERLALQGYPPRRQTGRGATPGAPAEAGRTPQGEPGEASGSWAEDAQPAGSEERPGTRGRHRSDAEPDSDPGHGVGGPEQAAGQNRRVDQHVHRPRPGQSGHGAGLYRAVARLQHGQEHLRGAERQEGAVGSRYRSRESAIWRAPGAAGVRFAAGNAG
jgi:hypothetical protein